MSKEFDEVVDRIIESIDKMEVDTTKKKLYLGMLKIEILKLTETEEIFMENMNILDQYSSNGSKATKEKRLK